MTKRGAYLYIYFERYDKINTIHALEIIGHREDDLENSCNLFNIFSLALNLNGVVYRSQDIKVQASQIAVSVQSLDRMKHQVRSRALDHEVHTLAKCAELILPDRALDIR